MILKIFKSLFSKLKYKILLKKFSKQFSSFEETQNYCNSIVKNSYANENLNNYRLQNFKLNFENYHILPQPSFKFLFETISFYLNHFKYFPKILDLGGGYGEAFLYLRNIFKFSDINYTIIEQNEIVNLSKSVDYKCQSNHKINFYNSLDSALKQNDYDLLFSSGTIQYLNNPYQILKKINETSLKALAFTRSSFSNKTKYFSQMTYLQLLFNSHNDELEIAPKNFNNRVILYPYTVIEEEKLINALGNFKISFTNSNNEPGLFKDSYSKDILLIRND